MCNAGSEFVGNLELRGNRFLHGLELIWNRYGTWRDFYGVGSKAPGKNYQWFWGNLESGSWTSRCIALRLSLGRNFPFCLQWSIGTGCLATPSHIWKPVAGCCDDPIVRGPLDDGPEGIDEPRFLINRLRSEIRFEWVYRLIRSRYRFTGCVDEPKGTLVTPPLPGMDSGNTLCHAFMFRSGEGFS